MKHLFITFILGFYLLLPIKIYSQSYGPYGGGRNYEFIPTATSSIIVSSDFLTIKTAIESAIPNDVIFIDIDDTANVTLTSSITIPNGVTVYGMRGKNAKEGAMFTYTTNSSSAFDAFILCENSRLTGIRLKGPVLSRESHNGYQICGVKIENANNIIIDNCEISHWQVGITINGQTSNLDNIKIHNNFIHHNMTNGFGYGIYVGDKSNIFVEKNIFDYNSHAIAGGGYPNSGYKLMKNIFLPNRTGQNFHSVDMHGCRKSEDCYNKYQNCYAAGGNLEIGYNTFITDVNHHDSVSNRYPDIGISGRPVSESLVHHNNFTRRFKNGSAAEYHFLYQRHAAPEANIECVNSGDTAEESILVYENDVNSENIRLTNNNFEQDIKLIYISWGGITAWEIIRPYENEEFLVGDFNGDGKSDLFKGNGISWSISWGGVSDWVKLGNSHKTIQSLFVKDWNRDGVDDLVYKSGNTYYISYFNSLGNFFLGTDHKNTGETVLPDFTKFYFEDDSHPHDNIPDYFETTGTEWFVTYSNNNYNDRIRINGSGKLKNQLIYGDFDGDGITDIMNIGNPPSYEGDFNEDGNLYKQ